MIRHISIDAQDPLRVAVVLAEILSGKAYKFLTPLSAIVMPFDDYGTHIVIFKEGAVWAPGSNSESAKILQASPAHLISAHTAMSVPVSYSQIEQIAKREGWRALVRRKSEGVPFSVVEFWVENRILFEFMPPDFLPEYLETMQPEPIQKMMGEPLQLVTALQK
jgi:hypothetical protein